MRNCFGNCEGGSALSEDDVIFGGEPAFIFTNALRTARFTSVIALVGECCRMDRFETSQRFWQLL